MKIINSLILLSLVVFLISGCDTKDGDVVTGIDLPLDNTLDLYSAEEGIYPDVSVLDDPDNPFADANLDMENVWDIYDECPSAKSKFYLWATMTAKIPIGEYQYYTAQALHELYTIGGSPNAKMQAKKAYRAVLDHFYNSVTWWEASWLPEETYYAVLLKDLTGQNLYDPAELNMISLYNDPVQALADLSEWGYIYDTETQTISKRD